MTTTHTGTPRKRDAVATRQSLLEAAQALFGSHGYDNVSLRDVGERAGVDASLIARYFGSKADLYLAALEADRLANGIDSSETSLEGITRRVLQRIDRHGLGPAMQAILQPETDPVIRKRALEYMHTYLVTPLARQADANGIAQPRLHAEMMLAALMGIAQMRARGGFAAISGASPDDLIRWILRVDPAGSDQPGRSSESIALATDCASTTCTDAET
jgi:AcrR family transcriptional regulator